MLRPPRLESEAAGTSASTRNPSTEIQPDAFKTRDGTSVAFRMTQTVVLET